MEMRFVFLTALIASIFVAHPPLLVDSSPPTPTISSSSPPPPPSPPPPSSSAALSKPNRETNGGGSRQSPPAPPSPQLSRKRYSHHHGARSDRDRRIRRAPRGGINLGKKIGLLFVGMAVVLQIAVVGFLGFKRWKISKVKESVSGSPA